MRRYQPLDSHPRHALVHGRLRLLEVSRNIPLRSPRTRFPADFSMRHQTFLVLLVIGLSRPHSFVVHGKGRGKQLRHRKCSSTDSLILGNLPAVLTMCFLETATRFTSTTWHENQ